MRFVLVSFFIQFAFFGKAQNNSPLFKLLPASQTGIAFTNAITENDTLNILNQANIYNGGGVGIGDFNNDGLQDIYFAGNMVSNKLYINKGNLKFEDQTTAAGVGGEGRWCTGVSVVDINADGLLDIYVSASFWKNPFLRTNLLYINQGSQNGIPTFKESAKEYGLADDGFSTQGYFFDYDRDGDLDLYQVTNALYDPKTPIRFRPKVVDGSALNTDRLYRNNGNGTFTNVSKEAGVLIEGWGHAACISDFNRDGWPDIYVANDFVSNDILYINNGNGTFTNRITDYFRHTGWNAMGTDVVDINNDGYPDVISLEMLPESNLRKKRMLGGNEYYNYFNSERFGYQHQYVRNVLQLSSGATPLGHPVFSDVAFMAGVYQTDWSWCPLVADFDNDGLRDMIITNGLPRDVTDLDYIAYQNGQGGGAANLSLTMAHTLPVVSLPNYAFKNVDGSSFRNTTENWGLNESSFSNGGAYADLDNDGDLDVVINNINGPAFVYKNTGSAGGETKLGNTLMIKLVGSGMNRRAIGARVTVYSHGRKMYYEHQPTRGYLSTVDDRAFFGLGTDAAADTVKVEWPDGKTSLATNVPANKPLVLEQKDATKDETVPQKPSPLFASAASEYGLHYLPAEADFVDYNIQPTLPHKLSQYGPGIAVGDIDGNGYDDFYIGGSSGNPGKFFLQKADGSFSIDSSRISRAGRELQEEMGVLFFDADNDGDLDLYAVSGSYEIPPQHPVGQDRLFLNNGKGQYRLAAGALPVETTNGSCVRAADFDGDGDLDLFVGGRVVSGAYPTTPKSFLLENRSGKFIDVTAKRCPQLQTIGMVTDALWTDFDNDGKADLVLTGEWMPVTFLKNTGATFQQLTQTGVGQYLGWWNSLSAGDFDNDGDMDYVAGNLGLNSSYTATASEPMTLLAKDLDNNGSLDAMVFCYLKAEDGSRKPFPMHAKDDLTGQLISIRKKYPTYTSYGQATMDALWPVKDRQGAMVKTATYMQSAFLENRGKGQFVLRALPAEAQTAPVFGMLSEDVDGDGNLDLLLVGNDYGMEPYSGRHDAFNGLCLNGDGQGAFRPLTVAESGFWVKGDAKGLARLHTAKGEDLWLATQNNDSLVVQKKAGIKQGGKWATLKPDDFFGTVVLKNGSRKRVEFYYGSTFLSQSSRRLFVGDDVQSITITNFKGQKRELL
ncbi:VCBS repeat-containing protein [Flavisolibacter nicotianae]|uniref:VCBS repeat-containing protein n=1 Tax=Flavisolibacter nicotianae TaxID=2364882 RepID=UPI0013C530AA|nr:VCBS repeat-containing protein [Flavisolibacter nicotianae]